MDVTIERSTAAEAAALVRVQVAAFHSDAVTYPGVEAGGPDGYDSVETMRRKIREDDVYTIRADGQIAGCIIVWPGEHGGQHLDVLVVDPALHGRGIGRAAMAFLERQYPGAHWTLDTPAYATRNHRFYEAAGYVKVREYDADGFALYAYEKRGSAPDAST